MSDGMKSYYPRAANLVFAASCVVLAIGVPFVRPPTTLYWSVCVFVVSYFVWRRFLRCEVHDEVVIGRSPETLKRTTLAIEDIQATEKGRFGVLNLPGFIMVDRAGNRVFLHTSVLQDPRLAKVLPPGEPPN